MEVKRGVSLEGDFSEEKRGKIIESLSLKTAGKGPKQKKQGR